MSGGTGPLPCGLDSVGPVPACLPVTPMGRAPLCLGIRKTHDTRKSLALWLQCFLGVLWDSFCSLSWSVSLTVFEGLVVLCLQGGVDFVNLYLSLEWTEGWAPYWA